MLTKKNITIFSVLFIVSFAFTSQALAEPLPRNVNDLPSNPNIHTRKDPSSSDNFSQTAKAQIAEQVELLKNKKAELLSKQNSSTQLFPKGIFAIAAYVSTMAQQMLDAQTKDHADLQEQAQAESLPTPDGQYHWNATDIIAYARESSLAARKALLDKFIQIKHKFNTNGRRLKSYVYTPEEQVEADSALAMQSILAMQLDKLIQIKRSLNTQARRIRQCVCIPTAQLQTVPVIVTEDRVFALAAGAAGATIIGELIVTGATVATGLYLGSDNHDPKNSPTPQAPAAQAEIPRANTTTATPPAHASRTNTTATPSKVSTKETRTAAKVAAKEVKAAAKKSAKETKATAQESIKKDIVFSQSNSALNAQKNAEIARSNATKEVVKSYKDRKQETQDNVINAAGSFVAIGCQQYQQEQNRIRKEKIIAEDRKKEENIQQRMRGGKLRREIEEEDQLRDKQKHQFYIEEEQRLQKAQEEYYRRIQEQKEKKKKNKEERKIIKLEQKSLEKESKRLKIVPIANNGRLANSTAPMSVPRVESRTTAAHINISRFENRTAAPTNAPIQDSAAQSNVSDSKINSDLGHDIISKSIVDPYSSCPYKNSTVCNDDSRISKPRANIDNCKNPYASRNAERQEKRYRNSAEYKRAEYREKKKQKLEQRKKQRQNDTNRISNSGPDKDPDDEDDDDLIDEIVDVVTDTAVDAIVDTISDKVLDWSKVIYEGNPNKHHQNSPRNAGKPPYNGKANIKKSVWVKTNPNGLSQRVGIENGNVIIYKEHAPNRYHGYIETSFNSKNNSNRYKDHRKALEKAGLTHAGKKFRIRK